MSAILADNRQSVQVNAAKADLPTPKSLRSWNLELPTAKYPRAAFVRSTYDEQYEKIFVMSRCLVLEVIDGKLTNVQAANALGAYLAAEIKKKVTVEGVKPDNAASTVAEKAEDKHRLRTLTK